MLNDIQPCCVHRLIFLSISTCVVLLLELSVFLLSFSFFFSLSTMLWKLHAVDLDYSLFLLYVLFIGDDNRIISFFSEFLFIYFNFLRRI